MYIFYFENYCETAELILLKLGGKVPKGKKRCLTQLGSKDQRSEVKNSWGCLRVVNTQNRLYFSKYES
ncbi:hypothetical protein HOLleu_39818 [Holothuria leucospilota]|uniref:Uncharacterized protein n=1 Tax=Holothuria leucospilota TaxID=206669 RepID=A0A9Q1BD36_HOLLE|nr:hypothetical protein HOLleu_39818 [Holothuria leucospilota]